MFGFETRVLLTVSWQAIAAYRYIVVTGDVVQEDTICFFTTGGSYSLFYLDINRMGSSGIP